MAQISNCLKIISKLDERDQDALVARLDEIQTQGVPAERAQIQAAIDVMAPLERAAAPVVRSAARQVDTPEFRKWFGDSKVVDTQGEPLVVYHGTNVSVDEFKPTKGLRSSGGLFESSAVSPFKFFAADREEAQSYASAKGGHRLYSVYLRMENPLDATTPDGLARMHRLFGSLDDTELSEWADSAVDLLDGMDELRATAPAERSIFVKRGADGRVLGQRATDGGGYVLEKYTAADHADEIERDLAQLMAEYEDLLSTMPSSDAPLSLWAALDEPGSDDRLRAAGFDGLVFHENDGNKTFAVLDSSQVKSATGNSGAFDAADPDITRSVARPQFYSQLQRAIEQVPDRLATMAAPQWKLWLDANAPKLGVKKDEIEWSGVTDYLALRGKEKVLRDDLVAYLADSGVRVSETVLGGEASFTEWLSRKYGVPESEADELPQYDDDTIHAEFIAQTGRVKYDGYTVPGGENYREVLITLPEKDPLTPEERAELNAADAKGGGARNAGNIRELRAKSRMTGYKSSHFDQPNIVAHLRVDDRVDADGARVMFINEIQSDWSQQGRKDGFQGDAIPQNTAWQAVDTLDYADTREEAEEKLRQLEPGLARWAQDGAEDRLAVREGNNGFEVIQESRSTVAVAARKGGVPRAPFVQDTKAWTGLALKRAIMMAVEGGYDKVALISGQQAADLYDLSKRVDSVMYEKHNDADLWEIEVRGKDGETIVQDEEVDVGRMEELIGKELAQKIVDGEGEAITPDSPRDWRRLSGLDLKVGGEGMRAFYDEIIPQVARDVLKKLGGGKLLDVSISSTGESGYGVREDGDQWVALDRTADNSEVGRFDTRRKAEDFMGFKPTSQLGFEITDAMREKVSAGVPLFSRTRGWAGFPDAIIATPSSTQSKDASYEAAKAGDMKAALDLVDRVLPADIEQKIRATIGDSKPIVAAVHAEEAAGRNKIPLATAFVIGERMGLQVDEKLAQASRAKRTGASGMARLGVQPEFAGEVEQGADYLLVDDTLAQGGTLAQLKTHIEDNGGRVVGVFALSGKQYSAKLSLDKSTLSDVRAKYEPIENWWKDELGFDFAGLTESEARYMLKSGLSPDALRDQVTAARQAAGLGAGQEDSAQLSRGRAPQVDTPEFKKWFGDSKVVNEDGKPIVAYHGTQADFDRFDLEFFGKTDGGWAGKAFYFTERPNEAGWYAKGDGANIIPVYLKAENPMPWVLGTEQSKEVSKIKRSMGAEDFVRWVREQGHDSIRMTDVGGHEDQWIVFEPGQIKSAIGNSGAFDPSNPNITQSKGRTASGADWESPSASKFDDLVYKFQDKQVETKRVVEAIKESSGSLRDDLNVYLNEEMYHGRAAKRTEDFVNMELDPLVREMAKANMKIADLEEFLHARHAKEANAVIAQRNPGEPALQDGGSGMTNAEADNYMATLPAADRATLEAAAKKVDAIIAGTRKMFVDYELESQNTVDAWDKMFKHYVPLQREDKEGSPGLGQGFSIKGKETKGRTGSTRKVVDILANIAMQRERAIVRGEKNRVAQSLVGLVKANENPDFWLVDEVPTERVFNPATGLVEDRVDPMYKSRDNAVVAKIKDPSGAVREHAVLFNEEDPRALRMAQALKNLDATQLNGLLGVSAKITRYFAAVNTQYNPVFGVVNLVRDVQGAMLNLTSTPLKDDKAKIARYTASALTGIYGDMRAARKGQNQTSKWAALWDEFQEVGGQTGYRDLFATSADRAEAIQNSLDPSAWMDSKLGKVFTAGGALKVPLAVAQKQAGFIFDWLSDYNGAMENGVRLAAYKAGLERGLSKQQAASIAKNLTTNFNRKGQTAQQAGAMYAFFNAAIQGTARIGQTLFDMEPGKPKTLRLSSAGKKIVYGGILLGSIQAMALAAAGFGEEDPPEFARERSLIIPTGNKTYVSIPMPLGMHIIPNIGRVATEFALSGFKDPIKRSIGMAAMFADAFNPIGNAGMSMQTLAPTALDPLVALTENKDWTGRPIAKTSFNKATPGHALGRDTATAMSEVLSEAINTLSGGNKYVAGVFSPTPDQIDYLLGQLTGGVGREYSKTEQTLKSAVRGETLPTYKIPLVGRFVGNAKGQASEGSAFYANVDKLNEIETEAKGLREDGKESEARKLLAANPESYLITQANYAERQAQKLRRQKSELIKAGAPREQVKSVEEEITAVMARLNRAMEKLKDTAEATAR